MTITMTFAVRVLAAGADPAAAVELEDAAAAGSGLARK